MPSHFYRRCWDDTRGDEFDCWGHSDWYFETDDDGWPVRQVEVYDAGPILRYGPGHDEDRYGGLSEASLYGEGVDWSVFEIPEAEFEQAWRTPPPGLRSAGASNLAHEHRPDPVAGPDVSGDRTRG